MGGGGEEERKLIESVRFSEDIVNCFCLLFCSIFRDFDNSWRGGFDSLGK